MKPVIGVCPLYDDEKESIWMLPGYFDVLQACGALPVMLPFTGSRKDVSQLVDGLDGALFTGGHDVDPALYGQAPIAECGPSSHARDTLEGLLLDAAEERDLPVLGICRGIQLFNVHWGGTLYQDVPTQRPSGIGHHMNPPYDRAAHDVAVVGGTPLQRLLGVSSMGVNSYHHQAICKLAPGLRAMAASPDGIVEAVCNPSMRFCWAVQWHPEFSWRADPNERKIVQAFVDACARNGS